MRLVYARDNILGAKLHVDPSNRLVVKIQHAPSLSKPYIMVMFQGDRYVSAKGINYLITPSYENMTLQRIVSHTKAYSELLRKSPSTSMQPMRREVRNEVYTLSNPPFSLEQEHEVSSHPDPTTIHLCLFKES